MLRPIEKADLPDLGGKRPSELRVFAGGQLEEFMEGYREVGSMCEVTGWPTDGADTPVKGADRLIQALNAERWKRSLKGSVRAFRRGPRVFLERTAE